MSNYCKACGKKLDLSNRSTLKTEENDVYCDLECQSKDCADELPENR